MSEQTMTGDELASLQKSEITFKGKDSVRCERLRAKPGDLEWFRDVKFGMFIHWGLYAIPAMGEWHMFSEKVPAEQYAKLADEFAPKHYDAAEWVRIAHGTGMKYMVLTARHHDGYALWDSPSSYQNYCSTRCAAKRDFVAEYVKACRDGGMRTGLYYSPMDWRFPGYFQPKELPDNAALMKTQGYGQVEELMKNYGKVDVLWYDGGWLAHKGTDASAAWFWEPIKLNTMVKQHQPHILISPRSGLEGDFLCDEGAREVLGPIIREPWEKCLNLNKHSWGFHTKQDLMTSDEVIRVLINVVGRGGNVLLNVGPDRDGVIPPAHVDRMREVGAWMEKFGRSIYGTRPGPFQPADRRYCATYKERSVFVHVLDWKDSETLELPALKGKVTACGLVNGPSVAFSQSEHGIEIVVPAAARQSPATVVELTLEGPL